MSLFESSPSVYVALGLGFVIFYLIFLWESRATKFLKTFPGPKLFPILGNVWELRDPGVVMKTLGVWRRTYGSRFRVFFGTGIKGLVLTAPEDVEKILTSSVVIDKGNVYDLILPWLGTGLLISTGKKWHTRRKQLTPAFHFKILESFQEVFNTQSMVLVDILKDKQGTDDACEMHGMFTRCALDIICETAMGKKLNCQKDLSHPYAIATINESAYFWIRFTSPWLHPDFMWKMSSVGRREIVCRKILHDFTDKVIQERKEEFLASMKESGKIVVPENDESVFLSSKKKFAFLDLLINIQAQDETQMTDRDIREETDTFMFEGHDTTAAALTWTLYLLARNPEQQAAVHEELDSIFGDDRERPVTPEDLTKLKFLESCIKEGLRLYPSVPFFMRSILKDFKLDDSTTLPSGTSVFISPWLTHRNPEIYPEPEEFIPSRFLPENSVGRHPYAYIPFSAGPRNCIGQKFALAEEKTVLANVLRNFNAALASDAEIIPLPELIVRPQEGINLKFKLR